MAVGTVVWLLRLQRLSSVTHDQLQLPDTPRTVCSYVLGRECYAARAYTRQSEGVEQAKRTLK